MTLTIHGDGGLTAFAVANQQTLVIGIVAQVQQADVAGLCGVPAGVDDGLIRGVGGDAGDVLESGLHAPVGVVMNLQPSSGHLEARLGVVGVGGMILQSPIDHGPRRRRIRRHSIDVPQKWLVVIGPRVGIERVSNPSRLSTRRADSQQGKRDDD